MQVFRYYEWVLRPGLGSGDSGRVVGNSSLGIPSGSLVNQDLCNDVRAYALGSANQELAPSLRHPASNF